MSIKSPSSCLCLTLCHIDGSPPASVRCHAEVFICVLFVLVVQLKNVFLVNILSKCCPQTRQKKLRKITLSRLHRNELHVDQAGCR